MHHFAYRNGVLHAEDVNLTDLAREVGTPFYCYSAATLRRHYEIFKSAFADQTRSSVIRSKPIPIRLS
jgi:diaminopimelate decarboxylase